MMLVIGLTGGIGSGKSIVSNLFAERNVPIIDSDQIARDITKTNQPAFFEIIHHFKTPLSKPDGSLDRGKLRRIIFNNPPEKKWLEKLLHPYIIQSIKDQLKTIVTPYCIVVIPLLFESNGFDFIDRILTVDTTIDIQKDRIKGRDKTDDSLIDLMIKSQSSRELRLQKTHDVIKNEGQISDLIPQVDKLHQFYLSLSAKQS